MKLIVGNLKMNLLQNEINDYLGEVLKYSFPNVVYCPSSIYLKMFVDNNLITGSQDVSAYEQGAYTGDVGASQLSSLGVKYVIIGHSERRKYYDDEKYLNAKHKLCIKNGLIPILCIGENKEEYLQKKTIKVLEKQLDILENIDVSKIIIAYEPIWSIGTGVLASNEEIYKITSHIKKYIYDKYQHTPKVLYGGSVNNQNIRELENILNIDGYLIGGCSIKVLEFIDLIKVVNKY